MALSSTVIRDLKKICPGPALTLEPEELLCYSFDATGRTSLPHAVLFPETTEQVSKIMAMAFKEKIPVVPRGSGSGMTGGTLPLKGGIVIVLAQMNRILAIDKENFTADVQPGVVTADFHKAVEKKGLFYPPDPASSAFCTLGGNIGECAGGPRAVKYGVTRDYVLGLEAVLPSGEVIQTGVRTAKGVAGYDLTRLIVGSEGTLAVVTRITLKLLALPNSVQTLAVLFDTMEQAALTVSAIIREAVLPRCVEYLDRASIECVRDFFTFPVEERVNAILILEVDGDEEAAAREARVLKEFSIQRGAFKVIAAKTQKEAADLWKARKALSPALYHLAPNKLNEDIVVPISKIPEMVTYIQTLREKTGLIMVSFGHAGDGNIHCNIMYDKRDKETAILAEKAVSDLFDQTLKLGGTITGEHGVGVTKLKYFSREVGKTEIAVMKGIKQVFDPHNILNPGKIF